MPGFLLLIARLGLAAMFATAGFAKLADRRGTREAVAEFGSPPALVRPVALFIPLAELAAAALLLPAQSARVGAAAAAGLLVGFSVTIAVNLALGRAPECHCFGQLHSAPAGPKTLARNGVLALVAVLVLVAGSGPSAVAWIGRLHGTGLFALVSAAVLAAVIAAGGTAFVTLLRSYGRILVRVDRLEQALHDAGIELEETGALEVLAPVHGLTPGTPAPAFTLQDARGAPVSLDDLLTPALPLLLVFASPHCGPCSALLPELGHWQRDHGDRVTVAVANDGSPADVRSEAEELSLEHMLLDAGAQIYRAFQANGTPSGVLIGPDGRVASHVAAGGDAIGALLGDVLDAPGIPIGVQAPVVELVGLDGSSVPLGKPADRDALLLFWNPDCGFCRAMHDDLLAWEEAADGQGPRLVVVSSGDLERSREDGFGSPVLLDPEFSAGDAFGVGGTPSAVRLDPGGRVTSPVVVGAAAVLALMGEPANPATRSVAGATA